LDQGASGVGIGNFLEIGPLDVSLNPRNSTWLQKADLIFVVSTQYSRNPTFLSSLAVSM
jgi:serine carboxypeptidase 1